jgi:uncharacterized protein YbaR (Trm112 family)
MAADPQKSIAFDASVLGLLACPACLSALRAEANRLVCIACGRAYPVVDGIPVLIVERAETPHGRPEGLIRDDLQPRE